MPALIREPAATTGLSLRELLTDIRDELAIQRDLLARLVALGEDRRAGERKLEELAIALVPDDDEAQPEFSWYRDSDAKGFVIIEPAGSRRATREEAAAIEAGITGRRKGKGG